MHHKHDPGTSVMAAVAMVAVARYSKMRHLSNADSDLSGILIGTVTPEGLPSWIST